MRSLRELEDTVLDSGELMKKTTAALINNLGKLIALTAAIMTVAITFTDVSFSGFFKEGFTSSLILILISGYIIYFSLENAGEGCGMQTDEYISAAKRYDGLRECVSGDDIEALRDFLRGYSERECVSRQNAVLIAHGLSRSSYEEYLGGKSFGRKTDGIFKKIKRLRPAILTPKSLLARSAVERRSELEDPERKKIFTLVLKLITSTVCTFVTVAVLLTAKEGLGGADILNALLRLSALPAMAFRGYSEGYSYSKHTLSLWLETKANILEAFFSAR